MPSLLDVLPGLHGGAKGTLELPLEVPGIVVIGHAHCWPEAHSKCISKFMFREGKIRTFLFGRKLHRGDCSHFKVFCLSDIRHVFLKSEFEWRSTFFLVLRN